MKKKIFNIFLSLLLIFVLSGCSDFLDITDKKSVSPDNFPTSLEQVDLLLNSSYAGAYTKGLYAFYWFPMGMYLYDKTSDLDDTYDARGTQLNNNADKDGLYITQTYADIFKWISMSNETLEGIERYRPLMLNGEEKELDYMKGQALFNRALAYWHGQIFFEINMDGWGLPLFEKVPKTEDERLTPRSTTKESWDFIIKTLKEAIPLLEGKTDKYRASEWAAKGLLAKVYMQAGYVDEAKPLLNEIITKSGKSLVSYSVYEDMFYGNSANEFNSESLYELNMAINEKQNGPWAGYTTGSGMPMVFAPWPLDLDKDVSDPDPNAPYDVITNGTGGWGNNYVHDANIHRFGFNLETPAKRVKNPNFVPSERRSITNFPYIAEPGFYNRSIEVRQNKEVDPRLYICAGQPYVDTYLDDAGRETFYDRSPGMNPQPDRMAWNHKKFTNRLGTEQAKNFSSDANYPIIRLADIYLLYAEAIKDTDPSTALEYINKVKRRAYDYPVDVPSPIDYKSLSDRTMAQSNDHLANDPLKYERWAELFGEGQWWYDIRRWKIGKQEIDYYGYTRNGTLTFSGDAYYVQPIPKIEVERYKGKMQQSKGYE